MRLHLFSSWFIAFAGLFTTTLWMALHSWRTRTNAASKLNRHLHACTHTHTCTHADTFPRLEQISWTRACGLSTETKFEAGVTRKSTSIHIARKSTYYGQTGRHLTNSKFERKNNLTSQRYTFRKIQQEENNDNYKTKNKQANRLKKNSKNPFF